MDESFKAVGIDNGCTAEQLRQIIIEKIGLKEDSCFSIFEKKDEWERCLEADEQPGEIMKSWEASSDKSKTPTTSSSSSGPGALTSGEPVFVFKKKIFLKDDDREMQDPVAKNLVYIQAVFNVIESVYMSTIEEALKLAGLKVHITYGDHNPVTHHVGFLSHDVKKFVPKHLFGSKKPSEWETLILKEHAKQKGKQKEDAKVDYLQVCKFWRDYGTTFFPPCKTINSKNLPNKVIIGVNFEGIRLLKTKNRAELISEHLFTEICSWSSSSGTFAFEFGSQSDSTKYTFETKHGAIIAATIQTYIDILVQMLKNGEDDEETHTGTTTSESHETTD
eukprot:TRINITY_DN2172_c0_g2_i1.p1 TRINITY_DN2172_c0_g2~~TRINITY_DN2172_c0_g2_i1.p1  ORF type:complete len:369 (+),score=65.70 TRINITY_DN2172_c0_g2_i1:107-1108(+)